MSKRIIKLQFPCPIKQTGECEIAVELPCAIGPVFHEQFNEQINALLGPDRACAMLEGIILPAIERETLLAQIK
jgi:hypothetical protein